MGLYNVYASNTRKGVIILTATEIIAKLIDTNNGSAFNKAWAEGYISALADVNVIDEYTFDTILLFISKQ